MKVVCDGGCGQEYEINVKTAQLGDGIEKVYFTCPHCEHEYVSFYTDEEIRKLQEKIRKVYRRIGDDKYDQKAVTSQKLKLRKQIETKMGLLRAKIEEA